MSEYTVISEISAAKVSDDADLEKVYLMFVCTCIFASYAVSSMRSAPCCVYLMFDCFGAHSPKSGVGCPRVASGASCWTAAVYRYVSACYIVEQPHDERTTHTDRTINYEVLFCRTYIFT